MSEAKDKAGKKGFQKEKKIIATKETVIITDTDQYLFGQGNHYGIYKKLGAHPCVYQDMEGTFFGVWAPNAESVHVIGDFNDWNEEAHPMKRLGSGGIYQVFIPDVQQGNLYKYLIRTRGGRKLYKADPYASHAQLRPDTASVVYDLEFFNWSDKAYMERLTKKNHQKEPLAIYECHVGSWMRHPNGNEGFYNYREFAHRIVEYLKELKFTHVELMGIAEHPFDGSWGYQVTGYYAPTSRYGTPEDFQYLIDHLHKHQIGVILDWVPAHFPRDAHGLSDFDGQALYEHPDSRMGEHPDWGTKIFNYGKTEVRNFLIANAIYWIKEYHIDGLRVDAVASMLYLDYGKKDGQWLSNIYGGNKNLDAIEFFKHLNSVVATKFPGVMMIAEESTAWPLVTGKPQDGGLGFTFKWNMGWMHDFCEYMKLDPIFRKNNHHAMTFSMSYNNTENYILPLSHDEVVHLKCSMVNKMPGYKVDKYANLRLGYAYMFGHSGKKLLFMGQEFGQEREWSEERELDWFLLQEELNRGMKLFVGNLLDLYQKYPCLYEIDNSWAGFEWMNADDGDRSIYSFIRKSESGKNSLLFILNMTPIERTDFRVGVASKNKHKLLLNSDEVCFGGNGSALEEIMLPEKISCNHKDYSIAFTLPAYTALVFQF